MKFTVIIPTRERSETLYATIKTATNQDYDNLEVLISDNFSQDNTRSLVESFKDPRIRYINTGKRVSMTENWEFAVSHVDSGYVTVIGDDDGLLPNAITTVNALLEKHPAPALTFSFAEYYWPNCTSEHRNLLLVPMESRLFMVQSARALSASRNFFYLICRNLPTVYKGFVDMRVLREIKSKTGRFFSSMCPDIYCGYAVMAVTDYYLSSYRVFGISGTSAKSNTEAFQYRGFHDSVAKMFIEEGSPVPLHPSVSLVDDVMVFPVVEPLLQVNTLLCGGRPLRLTMMKVLRTAYRTIAQMDSPEYLRRKAEIRDIARRNGLDWFARYCEFRFPNIPAGHRPKARNGIPNNTLILNGRDFGATDVYDASLLVHKLLRERPLGSEEPEPYTYSMAVRERFAALLGP